MDVVVDVVADGLRTAGVEVGGGGGGGRGGCTGEDALRFAADSRRSRAGSVRFCGVTSAMVESPATRTLSEIESEISRSLSKVQVAPRIAFQRKVDRILIARSRAYKLAAD